MNPKSVFRCALLLCSTSVPHDDELCRYTVSYLEKNGISATPDVISNMINKYHMGAKLYGLYRDNLSRIRSVSLIQEIYRTLWLYQTILEQNESLKLSALLVTVQKKYEAETVYNPKLTKPQFGCLKIIGLEFPTEEDIRAFGQAASCFKKDFPSAMETLRSSFTKLEEYSYMNEVFAPTSIPVDREVEKPAPVVTSFSAHTLPTEAVSRQTVEQLRDQIRLLKREKRGLQAELDYAKKDAVRSFLYSMTGYARSCPLSELYRLAQEEDTPERTRGIIHNLFMALSSENVRISRNSKEKVGSIIILDESNQQAFDPYENEELALGDKAEIYYPGYLYEHEMMVRPVVKKIVEKKEDPTDGNG